MILGLLVLFFLISLSLILFSVKIYISGRAATQEIMRESLEEELKEGGLQETEKEIQQINQELSLLQFFYEDQPKPSVFLKKLGDVLPEDSYFTEVGFQYLSPEEGIKITLKGFSPSWEDLRQLQKTLEEEFNTYEMDFPDTNWGNHDKFKMTLKVNT